MSLEYIQNITEYYKYYKVLRYALYRTDVSLTLRNLLLLPAKSGYVTILQLLILFIDIILISSDRKFIITTYKQLRYRYLANHLIFPTPSFKFFFRPLKV